MACSTLRGWGNGDWSKLLSNSNAESRGKTYFGRCVGSDGHREEGNLVMQYDIEEGAVDVKLAVVFNESQFPKFVHEETDS